MDWLIISFAFGILLAGWMMGRVLSAEAQRDPRWTVVLLGGVIATGLIAAVVLTLLQ